jgi:UDP-N-acetylglucosamine/UDP-N-acetylgalactosamine diphosphorylase
MHEERYAAAKSLLEQHGQSHLLTFYNQLGPASKEQLLGQIESIDWNRIDRLVQSHVRTKPTFELPEGLEPAPYYPVEPTGEWVSKYADARALGEQMLGEGKVAAFVVAGGSGTRLGWGGPKGTFPASPIEEKPLFQIFAEAIIKAQNKFGTTIPWYVMTSPANDAATRRFFAEHNHFGLEPENVVFFAQGTMPSMGYDGKVLLDEPDSIALSADGHGGSLRALVHSGALDDMDKRGIERVSYFQVDNPTVKIIDPLFLGLHAMDEAQMSSKMVAKEYGKEKLGNFCLIDGKMTIVEYSDLPDELAEERLDDGSLRFRSGSPAIHVIEVAFVRELNEGGDLNLPYHRADKKVPHLDLEDGKMHEPTEPNAVKLEQFVFDALPLTRSSIVLQTTREEEMAFIKNAEGESSPATSKQLQSDRACRWLEAAGVKLPKTADGSYDCTVELSHLTAIAPEDLANVDLPGAIEPGARVSL